MAVRVGTDIQAVCDVHDAIVRFGTGYTRRVYTEGELDDCGGADAPVAAELTARFAAKESVIKLLGADIAPGWHTIEIRRGKGGPPVVLLHGEAAELAVAAGIYDVHVSMSQRAGVAIATAVATTAGRSDDLGRTGPPGLHPTTSTNREQGRA